MNSTKLGLRLTSSVLATALCLAPADGVLAAPAVDTEGEDTEATTDGETAADPAEGEDAEASTDAEADPAEGEEADPESGDVEATDTEGEEAVDTEGEEAVDTEGEEAVDTEGEEAVDTEGEEAEEELDTEGEEVGEEAEEELDPPPPAGPQRPPEPAWGRKKQYPMNGKGMLIAGGVVTGLGAAFIITSVLVTRCDFDSALACKYGDQRDFLVPTAVAATGLGLMLVGVGIGNRTRYKKWENWSPEQAAVAPAFFPGGGGVAVAGRF
ncbi:hypothetical protein G6O69_11585 [Pseudenhygromyxa sp. WMMC2535]|uniref:hypothetical protein n=1 Tax=Pseudenhygromyxa sp. WMMC2535 TaxID=2712867 RepID=UPI001554FEA2|nr:hypothetical protein [Pseudenhygromyxa sp. WMMC2535]NVB38475.1 hypothetical protein [Pseudenhygromyxa sp. WMMC2535]